MKAGSVMKWLLVPLGAAVVVGLGYEIAQEILRDESVVPESSWTDSENIFPATKWIIPGLGEMLNVYALAWVDLDTGDYDILEFRGMFPACRYFSISVHTEDMVAETYAIKDDEIEVSDGNVNPFVPGNERKRDQRYVVYFVREGVPVDPGLRNVVVVPKHFKKVAFATRQYRPDNDVELEEAARPYPQVRAFHADMTPGIAPDSVGGLPGTAFDFLDFGAFETWYDAHLAFQRSHGNPNSVDFLAMNGSALGPGRDNEYLVGVLGGDFSKVAVISIPRAPTYERTADGEAFVGDKDVRYWSFCHAESGSGMVNDCVNDDRTTLNADGSVTLVVGPDALRQPVESAGLNFLPWTRSRSVYKPFLKVFLSSNPTFDIEKTGKRTLLVFRQVLADPSWSGSIRANEIPYFEVFGQTPFTPAPGDTAEVVLGDDGPRGFVIDVATFREGLVRGDFDQALSSDYSLPE